jgi:hypothetical protein
MYATILTLGLLVIGQVRVDDERWAKFRKEVVVAETVWTNALADGDFNNNGNWTNQTPDAAHTPGIFDGTTQSPPTTNLDRSGGGAFHLITTPEYTGGLGSSGTYLKWNGTGGGRGCTIRGSGDYYLHMVAANNADAIVDAPGVDVTFVGEIVVLLVKAGNVTIASTCSLLSVAIVNGVRSNVTIDEWDAAETMPEILRVEGGTVTSARTYTDAVDKQIMVLAGNLDMTGLLRSENDIHILGGVMTYDPASDPSGESPNLFVTGSGLFDVRGHSGTIPFLRVIQGRGGRILGTVTDIGVSFTDYNLDDPYP